MKKNTRSVIAVLILCAALFTLFLIPTYAATPLQSLKAGTRSAGYLDFDGYSTGNTGFDASSTVTYSATGTSARLWSNDTWKKDAVISVAEHSVDGSVNKYLSFVADPAATVTASGNTTYGIFPTTAVTAPDADGLRNDFLIIDIDVRAEKYVVEASDGTAVFYSSWEEVVEAGAETTAKLAYPENLSFRIDPAYSSYSLPVYIHSKSVETEEGTRLKSYLSVYSTAGTYGQMELSDKVGEWNHITLQYELRAVKDQTLVCRAYLDGKYVGKYTKSSGATSVTIKELRLIMPAAVINKTAATYAFGIDNWTANVYNDYVPTSGVENSIVNVKNFDTDYALYNCDDVVYNKKYLSPNGNSFDISFVDNSGTQLLTERIAIGDSPAVDKDGLDLGDLSKIKGDYKQLSAWEWNVSEDKDVFTPVGVLTRDMVKTVRARGEDKVTLRPSKLKVSVIAEDGVTKIGEDTYYNGSTVETLGASSNGWYSAEYSAKKNLTEGESEDSFIIKADKENRFMIDGSSAVPRASLEGILYNMSLLTNFYMNVYVPAKTPEGVSFLGFFEDAELQSEITENVRRVSIKGVSYYEISFEISNSDIDKDLTSYLKIEVDLGEEVHTLSYAVNVNMLLYCQAVTDTYECKSEESSLAVNLLRYADEAYELAFGEENSAAADIIDDHSSCGCLLDTDVTNEYRGDASGLSDRVFGISYSVDSQEPGILVFAYKDKIADVSSVALRYAGFDKDVEASFTYVSDEIRDGKILAVYLYEGISAADITKVMTLSLLKEDGSILASGTYGLANYIIATPNDVAASLYAFGKAAYNYKKTVSIPNGGDSVIIENLTVKKEGSRLPSMTVNPGDEIEYTITVRNDGDNTVKVPIYDKIPANTSLVSADALVSGFDLFFEIELSPGETKSVSYKVKVSSDMSLIEGGCILPTAANVGGNAADCAPSYVELTLNSYDAEFLKLGILASKYSGFKDTSLAKWMYQIAFTKNFTMSDGSSAVLDALFGADTDSSAYYREMVAPTLYGGVGVGADVDSRFKGERAERVTLSDLITGDLLIFDGASGAKLYIYDGCELISLTEGYEYNTVANVLGEINLSARYAVLRPSIVMTTMKRSDISCDEELTELQTALLETAKAYFLRGYRLQYDDTRFDNSNNKEAEYRWQIGQRAPEDYTSDEWGYINCAGFTYDIYLNALGLDLKDLFTTSNLVWQYTTSNSARVEWDGIYGKLKSSYSGYKMYPFFITPTHSETAEEALAIEERIMSELQVGDLVVIRRYVRDTTKSDTGHVMMYIGNGKLVHSTGSSFSYSSSPAEETYEPTIRYMNIHDYLFNPASSNYLFDSDSVVDQLGIVRPLATFTGTVPAVTENRIENLGGIVSEKLSSHKAGVTASVGEEVTFTFRLFNTNDTRKTVDITDVIGENCTLVSVTDGEVSGNNISFSVTLGARETREVSYTVKATGGEVISGKGATVGGVPHSCPDVHIKNTLDGDERLALIAAIRYYMENGSDLTGTELADAIYAKAKDILAEQGIESDITAPFGTDLATVMAGIFEATTTPNGKSVYALNPEGEYINMLAPTLYGGERLYTPQLYLKNSKTSSDRTRLAFEHDLVVGDILYGRYSNGEILYIYGGEELGFVSLSTLNAVTSSVDDMLVEVMGYYYYFGVLRPSQAK